jgi:hypothetical protein
MDMDAVAERIYFYTSGYPFLVSKQWHRPLRGRVPDARQPSHGHPRDVRA